MYDYKAVLYGRKDESPRKGTTSEGYREWPVGAFDDETGLEKIAQLIVVWID